MSPGDRSRAEPRRPRLVWVWRGFLALGCIAVALVVVFAATGQPRAAIKWAVVAVIWGAIGWWMRNLDRSAGPGGPA